VTEHCSRVVLPREQHGLEVDSKTLHIKVHELGEKHGESSAWRWNRVRPHSINAIEDGSLVVWCNTHWHDTESSKLYSEFHNQDVDTLIMDLLPPKAAEGLRRDAEKRLEEQAEKMGSESLARCIEDAQEQNRRFKLEINLSTYEQERARRSKLEQDLSKAIRQQGSAELQRVLITAKQPASKVHWEHGEEICKRRLGAEKKLQAAREKLGSGPLHLALGEVKKENIATDEEERDCSKRQEVERALDAAKFAKGSSDLDKAISEAVGVEVHKLNTFMQRVQVSLQTTTGAEGDESFDKAILQAAGDKGVKVHLGKFSTEREKRRKAVQDMQAAAEKEGSADLGDAIKACQAHVDLSPFEELRDKRLRCETALIQGRKELGSERLRRAIGEASEMKVDLAFFEDECTEREQAEERLRSARGSSNLDAVIKEVEKGKVGKRVHLQSFKIECDRRREAEEQAREKLKVAGDLGSRPLRAALTEVQREGTWLDDWDDWEELCTEKKRAEDASDKARLVLEQSPSSPYMVMEPVCVFQQPGEASSTNGRVSGFLSLGTRLMVMITNESADEHCAYGYVLRDPQLGIFSAGWVMLRQTAPSYVCWVSPLTAAVGQQVPHLDVHHGWSLVGTPYFKAMMTEEEATVLAANKPEVWGFSHVGLRTNRVVHMTLFREEARLARWASTSFQVRR